jgi:TolB protein
MIRAESGTRMKLAKRLWPMLGLLLAIGFGNITALHAQGKTAMLAVIEADGNLNVYDAAGMNPIAITTDAIAGEKIYQWPTWSTDGRLAFFGASGTVTDPYSLRVFIVDAVKAGATPQVAYSSPDEVFTYPYWSTGDCGTDCRELALLYTPPAGAGLGLRMIRTERGKYTSRVLGQAAPFYYSFSPDGKQMIWSRFGQQIELYDVAANQTRRLADVPGKFNSPMWSPVDERLLFGIENADPDFTDVVIAQGDARRVLLAKQETPISFAWSPDAKYVASLAAFDHVVITEVASGKEAARSSKGNVVAHFWSPVGDRVAYIVVNRNDPDPQARLHINGSMPAEQATAGLSLYVLDVKSGNSSLIATFNPTREYIYLLNFFDQFAHSHQLWSPDGVYLSFAAMDSKGKPTLYLADTTKPSTPIKVTTGVIGIWSWK